MDEKKWYASKIFWTGIVTIVTGLGAYFTGEQSLTEMLMAAFGALITIFRLFFTKTNLTT